MTAEEIGAVAHELSQQLLSAEEKAGIFQEEEPEVMASTWDEMPKWYKELYMQYVRLVLSLPETMLPHQIQELWIKDQESRGWKWGEGFDHETMTNKHLVPAREWDSNTRNRYFVTYMTINKFRRFYKPEPEVYTETVQQGVKNGQEDNR